jgi:hypothetical protein
MKMNKTEIIIKGEIHTSHGDLEEEREILKEGVDHIILEGSKETDWSFKPSQYWFAWILVIFEYLFARHVYVNKETIEDLAAVQDAELHFTRTSDASILENTHALVKVLGAVLFFSLLALALVVGLLGHTRQGSMWLLVSSLSPLLLIRIHESRRATIGRDIQIAEMIEEAAQDGERVVAIVGDAHAERVADALCNNLPEADVRPPAYSRFSLPHLKELVFPIIVSFSVLYVVYSGLLAYIHFVV